MEHISSGSLVLVLYRKVPVLDEWLWESLCHVKQGETLLVLSVPVHPPRALHPLRADEHRRSGYVKVLAPSGVVGLIYRDSVSILQKVQQ